ncbi:hypothetical protein PWE35_09405 [Stenotrophomonas maltophilia]|uniref:hypothetical protein n=1 Tax=Stenotrophomonas maltophilia TaxID=40324 RepID=UPI00237F6AE2|nr:hypothetical protein [Stenotrophomonas maltophilia]WDW06039.1 hypothetical protein PWE35_09405 [Stenotrophomonas maltophilia]
MSSGKKKTTNTTVSTNDPPAWSVPYFQQALGRASQLSQQPYIGYGGPTVAGFTPDQENAFEMNRGLADQNAQWQANAGKYVNDLINGYSRNPYSGENPYLGNMIDAANRDITQRYTESTLPTQLAQFNSGGAYGGSAMQQALSQGQQNLAQQLSDTNFQYRNADFDRQAQIWNQDQQLRQNALGFLPQLQQMGYNDTNQILKQGTLQQLLNQQAINDDRQQFNEWRDWDVNRAGLLTNALGAIRGGSNSNTTTGDNPNYTSAGQNAAGYAAILASLWGNS